LRSEAAKEKTIEYVFRSFEHYGWNIEDWVLLDNHYHLMAQAPEAASTLSRVMNNFHRFSALWLKKHVSHVVRSRPVWGNFRDTCITRENAYYARINYIWHNPVKHDYVSDARMWRYGSFYSRATAWDSVAEIIDNYPCDRVNVPDDF
jgi:putative transposase